jgi:asparagine synthase (glutamine-hydrolysing)
MCGIIGAVNVANSSELVSFAADSISHRGPDSVDFYNEGRISFGHVRLSIIDVNERSRQPFVKNGFAIVFNGEIYNYKKIRKELIGIDFITESDTEVLLEAWRKWGVECLKKLRGMFAFSIYDIKSGDVFIVRDNFGIKPLFYKFSEGGVIFSSELKGIEKMTRGNNEINSAAIVSSMMYVWIPEEQCIWKDVKKIPPGCYLHRNSAGVFAMRKYWCSTELFEKEELISDEEGAIEYLSGVIANSVESHLIADVPINAFLSGGLDSSLIVAMARQHLDQLDCFTIRFAGEDQRHEAMTDDAFYAEKVARQLGVKLNILDVQPELTSLLPKIVHHLDEPIGDSAAISTFLICDNARKQGVKVLLSGMGADELFAGYRKHQANVIAARYRKIPAFFRTGVEWSVNRLPVSGSSGGYKFARWAKRFSSFAGLSEADAFLRSYTYFSREDLCAIFQEDVVKDVDLLIEQHHATYNSARHRGQIDAMCFTDVNRFMTSLNLTYTDRASMAASTEVRVPFIDIEVAKAAFSISGDLKLKNGIQKYILKKVAEKWLPKEIIYRPKSSFTLPLRSWMKKGLVDMVDDYITSPGGLISRGIFKPDFLKTTVKNDRSGIQDNAQIIWHLLTIEQWLRNHKI